MGGNISLERASAPRAAVILHLRDDRGRRIEHPLLANPADEGNVDVFAVKIAGKIEQEDFEQYRAGIEHRPPAKTRHAVVAPSAGADAYCIDAMAQPARRVELKIGGGKAELAASL